MIVLQVLNFDPVTEILKILMNIVIILRKIHVKFFAPPWKETKHIHASAADLLYTVLE